MLGFLFTDVEIVVSVNGPTTRGIDDGIIRVIGMLNVAGTSYLWASIHRF
jgi:hypothetical protein